jgi:photosystem II stability/assembly factor-like uncharacterized protein
MKTTMSRGSSHILRLIILTLCLALGIPGMVVDVPAVRAEETRVWTQLPLYGGSIQQLVIDPKTPTTLYAATGESGLFRSSDSGATWTPLGSGLPSQYVIDVVVDPVTPSTLYVTDNQNGVFRSADSGKTWTAVNTSLPHASNQVEPVIRFLSVHPKTPSILYAGTDQGLFRSMNSGRSWTALNNTPMNDYVFSLVISPSTPATMYASANPGICRSTDGGVHWTLVNNGLTQGSIASLALDPVNPSILYSIARGRGTSANGVFRSTNGGNTWTAMNTGLTTRDLRSITVDPRAPTTLYVSTGTGLFRSTNSGRSWTSLFAGGRATGYLAIDPKTPAILYSGNYRGVFRSADSGHSWAASSTGITAASVAGIVINPRAPNTMYAAPVGGAAFRSLNGGRTWADVSLPVAAGSMSSLAMDPKTPATLYASTGNGIFRSTDSGATWKDRSGNATFKEVQCLAVDPATPSTIYAGTVRDGAFRSTDGGATWKGLTALAAAVTALFSRPYALSVDHIAIDSRIPATLFAATNGGLFHSKDAGSHWARADTNLMAGQCSSLVIDPIDPNFVYYSSYYSINAGAGGTGGAFRSQDGGKTWLPMDIDGWETTSTDGWAILSFAVDPRAHSTVYAATLDSLFCSIDSGATWTKMNINFPHRYILGLAADPLTPWVLYVGMESGIFRYGPVSPKKVLKLTIGQTTMQSDGTSVSLETAPIILNDRTLLPIRAVIEAAGGTIAWDAPARKVTITRKGMTLELWIGKNTARVDGTNVPIDTNTKVVPIIRDGRTLLPLRFVGEALGFDVQWNAAAKLITLTYES